MALVIEDGSLVAGANSFSTVAELKAYALQRGIELSTDDSELERLLVLGADYLNAIEHTFRGERVSETQELSWPRSGVYLFASQTPISESTIPALLKKAQNQLAIDSMTVDLLPSSAEQEMTEVEVDVLTVKYAERNSTTPSSKPNKALSILAPLLKTTTVQTVRL